ncbi:MAG: response regulator transcription factor [Caldilineaceae bacterium]|nr:response regulator transcription factor [Caldilineaceae bacterium]
MSPTFAYKIFIVEDHPIIRQGYVALIERETDLQVCGESHSVADALEKIPQTDPHLVIVDISLGEVSGIELLKELQHDYPDLPAIVVSGHDESVYGDAVFRFGAKAYITKESPHLFMQTIRSVLNAYPRPVQTPPTTA